MSEKPNIWYAGAIITEYWLGVHNGFTEKITVRRLRNGMYFLEHYCHENGREHYDYLRINKARAMDEARRAQKLKARLQAARARWRKSAQPVDAQAQ